MAYAFDPSEYYRWPVAVTPGAAASTAIRVSVQPSPGLEKFWDAIDSNGYSVRFADSTGGPLAFNRAAWTYASRSAEFRVQFTTPSGTATADVHVIYMYVKKAAPALSDSSVADTASTMYAGNAFVSETIGDVPVRSGVVVGDTLESVDLPSTSYGPVAVSLAGALQTLSADSTYNGSTENEAPRRFTVEVLNSGGSDTTARYVQALHRLIHDGAAFYLLPWISGGDTSSYRLRVTVEMGSTLRRIVRIVALRFRLPSA